MFSPVTAIPAVETHPAAEQPLKGTTRTLRDPLLSGRTSVCPHWTGLPTDLELVLHFSLFSAMVTEYLKVGKLQKTELWLTIPEAGKSERTMPTLTPLLTVLPIAPCSWSSHL